MHLERVKAHLRAGHKVHAYTRLVPVSSTPQHSGYSAETFFKSKGILTSAEADELKALMVQVATAGLTAQDSQRVTELVTKLHQGKKGL